MSEGKREKSKKYPGVYWRLNSETGEKVFYVRYRLGGRGSKEVEEPVGKSRAGMTEAKAAQARALKVSGKAVPNTVERAQKKAEKEAEAARMTISKLWEEYKAGKTISRKRLQTDQSRFVKYLEKPFGAKTPEEIDALSVARLKKSLENMKVKNKKLEDKKLAPATIWGVLELLARVINFGVDLGLCAPLSFKITKPKLDNEKTEFMSDDQLRAYLAALDEEPDQDDAAFFRIMLLTGIRRTALLNVRWSDVDLEGGFLTLRGEVAKAGKTKTIPLAPAAVAIFQGIANRGEYVWPGKSGAGPREDFRRLGRRLRDKAGLPREFRPCHGLRHHYASALASSGEVDMYALQRLLTHSTPVMTQRYSHLSDEALKRAAKAAENVLADAVKSNVVNIEEGKK